METLVCPGLPWLGPDYASWGGELGWKSNAENARIFYFLRPDWVGLGRIGLD